MHSGLRSAAMNGPTTPPRRPAVISSAAARCAGCHLLRRNRRHPLLGHRSCGPLISRFRVVCSVNSRTFPRQTGDERADRPAEPERDVARQRDRLAFQVHAAVALLEPPVRIEAPQIPAAFADRLCALGARAGARHLGQPRAANPAARAARTEPGEARVVLAVHDDGDHLRHHEPQREARTRRRDATAAATAPPWARRWRRGGRSPAGAGRPWRPLPSG